MNVTLQTLRDLITSAVDAGVQAYIRTIEPTQDIIKQAEAKRYIVKLGYQPIMLQRWKDAKLLTPVKVGDARNSAVWYSLADIKNVITTVKLKNICNESY